MHIVIDFFSVVDAGANLMKSKEELTSFTCEVGLPPFFRSGFFLSAIISMKLKNSFIQLRVGPTFAVG
jgi:hypothetical protein